MKNRFIAQGPIVGLLGLVSSILTRLCFDVGYLESYAEKEKLRDVEENRNRIRVVPLGRNGTFLFPPSPSPNTFGGWETN